MTGSFVRSLYLITALRSLLTNTPSAPRFVVVCSADLLFAWPHPLHCSSIDRGHPRGQKRSRWPPHWGFASFVEF